MTLTQDQVRDYLLKNPGFLESFVTSSHISKETFQRWTWRRDNHKLRNSITSSSASIASLDDQKESLLNIYKNRNGMLYELGLNLSKLLNCEKFELLVPGRDTDENVCVMKEDTGAIKLRKARKHRKDPTLVLNLNDPTDKKLGELHFYSIINDRDRIFLSLFERWGTGCIYFSQLYKRHESKNNGQIPPTTPSPSPEDAEFIARQRRLNSFLLEVVKSLFQDIETTEVVIKKVLSFAQQLVDADRASLFFVDYKNNELYARIFDNQLDSTILKDNNIQVNSDGEKEIRFPIGKGVAGYVARSGESLNIPNAYQDERFNPEVDSKTGYHTTSILCMPIYVRKSIIGVMQMVNKKNGTRFTQVDEEAFETFSLYCGLALHHSKLYEKIRRSETKHRVAMEVLSYHSCCNRDEVAKLKRALPKAEAMNLMLNFDFNQNTLNEIEKPLYAVCMFDSLFKEHFQYPHDDVIRFVLTVRKNYRRVPYHNWTHGWTVVHAVYVVLKKTKYFTPLESLALFISCICHDLDHRGKNNAYMKSMETPLAAIYSTSVMEHHHFNQTVTILQQEGHNILQSLSREEYKQILGMIKHCILATDLALFFPNKANLNQILKENQFNWENKKCRLLTQAILMTSCDLIASAKPWAIQTETVKVIFEEFYEQGDAERVNGKQPIPMMDRDKADELPQMQVGFMKGICVECYDLISQVIPETNILKERARNNLDKWAELARERAALKEEALKAGLAEAEAT